MTKKKKKATKSSCVCVLLCYCYALTNPSPDSSACLPVTSLPWSLYCGHCIVHPYLSGTGFDFYVFLCCFDLSI